MPCSYCQERGHNILTCPIYKEKQDAKREHTRVKRVEKKYKKMQIINQKLRKHKLLEKENEKLRSKTERQDKTIRRLRKKITEKNKTSTRETALMASWIVELKQALEDSKKDACNETEELTCSICYNIINKSKNITKTECGHCFHTKCLMIWVGRQKKNSCPNCRQKVY